MPKKHLLLIVDDEKAYANSLAFALRKDFETHTACTYQEAIETLTTGSFDAALLDVRLDERDDANQDGLRILQWLKQNQPQIHGFVMSSYKDMGYKQKAMTIGCEYFFEKPIDILHMRSILEKYVQ